MIPVGYMAKHVYRKPEWLKAPQVVDIYSVSGCVSENFANYIPYWKHNGYWFFDSPGVIRALAADQSLDLSGTMLFYYEVYDQQWDGKNWLPFAPEPSFPTDVVAPTVRQLEGFDVATFYVGTSPECSPLSCNSLASDVPTNGHCLFSTFAEAKKSLTTGAFADCEPGPYRIFAVYSTPWVVVP